MPDKITVMEGVTKHRNYETDRKVRFTDESINSHQNTNEMKVTTNNHKTRGSLDNKVPGGGRKSSVDFPRRKHAVRVKSKIQKREEEQIQELSPAMSPSVEVYVPPPTSEEDKIPPIHKGNPDNLLQTIVRKMTAVSFIKLYKLGAI